MNISYYRKVACVSAGVLLWLFAAAAFRTFAEDIKDLNVVVFEREYQIKKEVETKIKNEILDPMLGRDRASVFADIELDIIANKHDESGSKLGVSQFFEKFFQFLKIDLRDWIKENTREFYRQRNNI